ncbi:MAG: iron uptake porin, partial [Pseudanabaena sp.]
MSLSSNLAHAETTTSSVSVDPYKAIQLSPSTTQAQNITSVSQLSDVKPTDWAFTALQSLVERYGCIAGYPDSTFRGKQATSRYEFAAGLNACLDKINEIISAGLADKVSKEDLATLQKLQEEFAAELATLRGRVDALDAKTAKLEAQQFSTTTKLTGEVIFSATAGSGGPTNARSNITLGNRTRLVLNTSFTGKDSLRTRLEAGNNFGSTGDTSSLAALLGTNTVRIGPGSGNSSSANTFNLTLLDYKFPVFDNKVTLYVAPISFPDEFFTVLSPVASNGQGSISRFGRFDPLMRIGATSSLFAFDWKVSDQFKIQAGYGSSNPASPAPGGQGGLFGGSTIALVQLLFKPTENLDASVT